MEVWLHAFSIPGRVSELARRAQEWGFTGLLLADSQNLTADIWIELALAGAQTSRLRLGPGVTNPITRHLAVTASAAATLQAETGGRVSLGFAQGDSALTQIGREPLSVAAFERALARLQGLLRGEVVELERGSSAIRWLASSPAPKVPIHVAASGPRTIAAGARHAEGIDLTVGAELERIRWGVEVARAAAPSSLTVGAYVNVAVDPDRDRARELVRGSVATFARFSQRAVEGLSAVTGDGVRRASAGYETAHHGQSTAGFARQLEDAFIDRFAVAGPAQEVRQRLSAIGACGVQRIVVVPGSLDADADGLERSNERFAADVLPALG